MFSFFPRPRYPRDRSSEESFLHHHLPRGAPRKTNFLSFTRGRGVLTLALCFSLIVWILLQFTPIREPLAVDPDSITTVFPTLLNGSPPRNWTFELPEGLAGLLHPKVYADMCMKAQGVAGSLGGSGHSSPHRAYDWVDESFLEPTTSSRRRIGVCEKSLTYMLESTDHGFGVMLLGLWSAYGLAKLEGREFFISDRNWAWGKYASFFLPPKSPSCRPPPPNMVLPCPHHARHLVVAHSTTSATFGYAFNDLFEDPRKIGVQRQHKIFALARSGYESLFRLRLLPEDEEAVEARKTGLGEAGVAGIHVRRGDGKTKAFKWKDMGGQVPNAHYAKAVAGVENTVVLASDDPAVYSASEFPAHEQAQNHEPAPARLHGGFTNEAFLATSTVVKNAIGREYLRDIKILGEAAGKSGGKMFCDAASATCRVLGVVMGWQRAVEEEGWKNIGGDREWFGVDWW